MRTPSFLLRILTLLLLPGCVLLEEPFPGRRTRLECHREDSARAGTTSPEHSTPATADTALYFSAVRFPDDYDWQRDTAYGTVPYELLLYRNLQPVLSLRSGPGCCFTPDPDRHHLLSGHLYTERTLATQTLVGRDGAELFRFAGHELLVGLLEDGEDLYTLSRKDGGLGFSLRCNGRLLFEREEGSPYGNLSDPSYGPGGALYRDREHIVFCYHSGKAGSQAHYLVRDGEEIRLSQILPGARILDLRYIREAAIPLQSVVFTHSLSEGRIWPESSGYSVTGLFSDPEGRPVSGCLPSRSLSTLEPICEGEAFLYHSAQATYAVVEEEDGTLCWYGPDGGGRSEGPARFLSADCALALGAQLILAYTPRDGREPPRIRFGGQVREVELNGYVSGVGVEINPAPTG